MVPVLKASSVTLRAPQPSDIEARVRLGRDPDIHRMFGMGRDACRPLTLPEAAAWTERLASHSTAWIIDIGSAFGGEIRLDNVNLRDKRATMAVAIYDPAFLGRGFGSTAIRLVLGHAFATLELHRIGIRVLAYNERAIRAYQKCGFVVEGRERETACVDGQWHDDIMMGLLAHEFLPGRAG